MGFRAYSSIRLMSLVHRLKPCARTVPVGGMTVKTPVHGALARDIMRYARQCIQQAPGRNAVSGADANIHGCGHRAAGIAELMPLSIPCLVGHGVDADTSSTRCRRPTVGADDYRPA